MISIRNTIREMEVSNAERAAAIDSYAACLDSVAEYAVELDSSTTPPHRAAVQVVAEQVRGGTLTALAESRSQVRTLLRDYREKAAQHLGRMRLQLESTADMLQRVLQSLSESDGARQTPMRRALQRLRSISHSGEPADPRTLVELADVLEAGLDELRRQNDLTVWRNSVSKSASCTSASRNWNPRSSWKRPRTPTAAANWSAVSVRLPQARSA